MKATAMKQRKAQRRALRKSRGEEARIRKSKGATPTMSKSELRAITDVLVAMDIEALAEHLYGGDATPDEHGVWGDEVAAAEEWSKGDDNGKSRLFRLLDAFNARHPHTVQTLRGDNGVNFDAVMDMFSKRTRDTDYMAWALRLAREKQLAIKFGCVDEHRAQLEAAATAA